MDVFLRITKHTRIERIADQKAAVKTLVVLYKHSADLPSQSDTLTAEDLLKHPWDFTPKRFLRQISGGVKAATSTTATVFGNVASEIMGSTVLQPNSPQAIVKTMLESRNKMVKVCLVFFLGSISRAYVCFRSCCLYTL